MKKDKNAIFETISNRDQVINLDYKNSLVQEFNKMNSSGYKFINETQQPYKTLPDSSISLCQNDCNNDPLYDGVVLTRLEDGNINCKLYSMNRKIGNTVTSYKVNDSYKEPNNAFRRTLK